MILLHGRCRLPGAEHRRRCASIRPRENREAPQRAYRRRVVAWSLYDWANHGYITVTATTFFPPHFIAHCGARLRWRAGAPRRPRSPATPPPTSSRIAVSLALFVAAVLAPLVGTYADITGRRKRLLLGRRPCVGAALASAMFALTPGRWRLALALYIATQVAVNLALGLNSSLLPHVARPGDLPRASSLGYAMGYVGRRTAAGRGHRALPRSRTSSGIDTDARRPHRLPRRSECGGSRSRCRSPARARSRRRCRSRAAAPATRWATPFRAARPHPARHPRAIVSCSRCWSRSGSTWRAIGAIVLLATAYGAALGLDTAVLDRHAAPDAGRRVPLRPRVRADPGPPHAVARRRSVAMLLWTGGHPARSSAPTPGPTAASAVPTTFALLAARPAPRRRCSLLAGRHLVRRSRCARLDAKRAVILGLAIYTVDPDLGFRPSHPGRVLDDRRGSSAPCRAAPRRSAAPSTPSCRRPAKSGEFFGLYGLSEKFAGILGPLLYGVVGQLTHNPRASILSVSVFFLLGIVLLTRVDVAAGARARRREEAVIEAAPRPTELQVAGARPPVP